MIFNQLKNLHLFIQQVLSPIPDQDIRKVICNSKQTVIKCKKKPSAGADGLIACQSKSL
jgi:hypothetical protein